MKKHHLGLVAGILVVAALAVYAWLRLGEGGFHWAEFRQTLSDARPEWLAAAVVCIIFTYFVRALRWEILLRPLTTEASLWRLMSSTCIGFTAVVLFGRPGEAVRPYLIAKREGLTVSSQLAAWVVERMLDMIAVLLVFGVALTQVENSGLTPGPRLRILIETGGWIAGLSGLACLAVLIGLRQYRGNAKSRIVDALGFLPNSVVHRIHSFMTAFGEGMKSTRQASYAGFLIFYTVLLWGMIAATFYCVFQAFPQTASMRLIDIIITLGFIAFGSVVQIPGIGGGAQIAAILVLTELYHLNLETASGVALILWVMSFLVVVPLGMILAFHEGIKWRNMKRVGDETGDLGI